MANLAKFKADLAAYAEDKGGLPEVVLSQTTDLGQAFSSVVCVDNRVVGESNGNVAGRYVDEFCATLGGEEYKTTVDLFNRTTAAFAEKVKTAIESLNGIREKARTLAADIEKTNLDILAKDEFYTKYVNYAVVREDFPTFGWQATKVWGTLDTLAKAVNGMVVAEGVTVPSYPDARLFGIVVAGLDKHVKVEPVKDIDEATRAAAIDQLKSICADLPCETVENAFDMSVGIAGYLPEYTIISKFKTNDAADIFANIKTLDKFVLDNYTVVDAIISDQVKLPDTCKDAIKDGAKKLQNFCQIAAYYELMQRQTVFRDAYLLQGGLVNADTKDAYTTAGGTPKMVANYIRKMYKDNFDAIPAMGIRGEAIIKADSTIADEVEEITKGVMDRVEVAKANARTSAFRMVASNYISQRYDADHADSQIDPAHRSNYIGASMNKVGLPIADSVRQYNICPVEASINLIVGVDYPGSFVEHLQKKLGAAYLALTNMNTAVSNEDIRCAEVGVIADLVVSFVVDNMVEAAKCVEPAAIPAPAETPAVEQPQPNTPSETPVIDPNAVPATKEEVKEQPGVAPAQEA